MTFSVKGKKHHHRVIFKRRAMASSDPSSSSSPTSTLNRLLHGERGQQPGFIIEESTETGDEPSFEGGFAYRPSSSPFRMSAKTARTSMIPDLFTSLPPIRDLLNTETSQVQDETIQECLPFLSGTEEGITYNDHGVPHLDRKRHIAFLHKSLRKLPAPYVAADASRPWMFYWALAGLSAMGEDISEYREKIISTCRPIQNVTGGFGGGNGQMSHLAPTYAIILSLSMIGGTETLGLIDRKSMWKWLGALKQPDGGFQMSVGGEEDIR
jgi:protein farnesyltransferase subunit beta